MLLRQPPEPAQSEAEGMPTPLHRSRETMMLVLSLILGIVPLLGVAWIVLNASVTTVDGLFMSLILLTLSGILFLNAYLEVRGKFKKSAAPSAQKTS
jgi:hypothetical protein